jgi:hypothetical protein
VRRLSEYLELLNKLSHFHDLNQRLILRHDIDFGLGAGQQMVEAEKSLGIESITFIRMDSDCFNPRGKESAKQINRLAKLGMIGLHMNSPTSYTDIESFHDQFYRFKGELESIGEVEVKDVSWHRPHKLDLGGPSTVNGLRNFYSAEFFLDTLYVSDSANSWTPQKESIVLNGLSGSKRVQLLIHPEWWFVENASKSFNLAIEMELQKVELELNREITYFGGEFELNDLNLNFGGRG